MPADIHRVMMNKELILTTLKNRGPSLPIHLGRAANLNLIFTSAYLSELFTENRIKMSNMRVGSSPIYYLSGQEAELEKYIEYLAPKEREAYLFLKQEKIAEDEKLLPAIRVALKELKDFAVPIQVKIEDQSKQVWKFYLIPDEDVSSILHKMYKGIENKKAEKEGANQPEALAQTTLLAQKTPSKEAFPALERPKKSSSKSKKQKSDDLTFANKLKESLQNNNYEVLSIISAKKKDCSFKVALTTLFGKQEYMLFTKDKKKIIEDDLAAAIHKAHAEKMPAIFMTSGTLDADAQNYAQTWRNLIKIEKLKL